ncbi:MAG: DnaJ domain-containing protein [Oscillospiraceae bacterium]|nr:DnaJ domain-containing protein [Oscillospiraceae bacterium]
MIDDPYKVLGVPSGAGPEEIKRAYRKKIKEYHPDLHPNDPVAAKKTNEINEAYDMLQNPEKYEAQRRQQQQRQQQSQGAYGYGGQQRSSQSYQGPGGWASDFGGFNFDDIFGFGFSGAQQHASVRPEPMPGDSREIRFVVSAINSGHYQDAVRELTQIPGTLRNARWYYLSSLANHGLGNGTGAIEHMQKAVQLDPNKRQYHQLLQQFRSEEQSQNAGQTGCSSFHVPIFSFGKIIAGLLLARLLFGLLQLLFGMGAHMYYLPG